ncbi:hypothetical protein F2Q69_00004712 [Brassica cretica]|uniref:Uncharacterized protein n=2 Tax=Brassica TaxID=3705 RepID=A0A8S9NVV1_BRACR|nr:hypothetical protein F2Q69_00004712 [Brassica cretica]
MKILRNISSELPRIGPSENPSKYPEEVLPRYIPMTFPTNWWSSEFPRNSEEMNFRRVIYEDLFPPNAMAEAKTQSGGRATGVTVLRLSDELICSPRLLRRQASYASTITIFLPPLLSSFF